MRLAFVTSVMWRPLPGPPVRFQTSQEIDRAEERVAGFRLRPRLRDMVEQPFELEAGEIARERQAGLSPQAILAAVAGERGDERVDPRVLPDERVVERAPGAAVPQERGLALIRDADRREVGGRKPLRRERVGDDGFRIPPDLLGIVLDMARRRIDLGVLALRHRHHGAVAIEDDEARARRALVDRAHIGWHESSRVLRSLAESAQVRDGSTRTAKTIAEAIAIAIETQITRS